MSDIKSAVTYLQDYMNTYSDQQGYEEYRTETLIDDVLYGLGAALDENYKYAQGYEEFKKVLRAHLGAA
ncbi:hypothetical protein [Marinobacter salarius]|uniref:Uncharacterized protein n=1 Tax=Marinobacter salarius TaxID=1420917 RepID=A0A1W6K971_9GAMM|nr:hypothetical protein [Marinobacter salarius]ARM83968.1 hypothetical protein MARSALSMR5_01890 [Marinobacter salarius]